MIRIQLIRVRDMSIAKLVVIARIHENDQALLETWVMKQINSPCAVDGLQTFILQTLVCVIQGRLLVRVRCHRGSAGNL
jgi:hypothetical protein